MLGGLDPSELLFELEQDSAGDHDEEREGDDSSQPVVDFTREAVQGLKIVPTALIGGSAACMPTRLTAPLRSWFRWIRLT